MLKKEFENIKILYVEDELNIRNNVVSYLKRMFRHVDEASNALEAMEIFEKEKHHIIITDIQMPQMTGLEMVEQIRKSDKDVQIIVLTAFTQTEYLLKAVELGLVKYLIKPIHHNTLLPVLLQCAKTIKEKKSNLKHISENCIFDIFNQILVLDGQVVKLTKSELQFLNLLCTFDNRTVTYEEIERDIWYDSVMSDEAIRSLVRNLRRKLPKDCLKNFSGIGYKIEGI